MATTQDSPARRLKKWRAGRRAGPWEIFLMVTARCNLRCNICWQRRVEKEQGRIDYSNELSDERLLRLVDEAADLGVREWTIIASGETMVRGDLVMDLCERIRERGMNGAVHSNGTLFAREHFDRLINIGWSRVHVSLDGPTAEVNDHIRSEGSFKRATEGLRLLDEMRKEAGVDKPLSSIHMALTHTNHDKLDQMVRLAHNLGCSGGLLLALLNDEGEQCDEFRCTDADMATLPKHLEAGIAEGERLGVSSNLDIFLPNREVAPRKPENRPGSGLFDDSLCFEAWLTPTIASDGKLGPCCMFWDEEAETLHDKTLEEVWYGPYMERMRERLMTRTDVPPYCAECPSHLLFKTDELRQELGIEMWEEMTAGRRVCHLARRVRETLQKNGLGATARMTLDWLLRHSPLAPRNPSQP